MHKGTAYIRGTATKEEMRQFEVWEKHKTIMEEELVELYAMRDDPDCEDRDDIIAEIAMTEMIMRS